MLCSLKDKELRQGQSRRNKPKVCFYLYGIRCSSPERDRMGIYSGGSGGGDGGTKQWWRWDLSSGTVVAM